MGIAGQVMANPGPLFAVFEETLAQTAKKVVDYLVQRLETDCAAYCIPSLDVTAAVMENAPKLPDGRPYPLTPAQVRVVHPAFGLDGLDLRLRSNRHCLVQTLQDQARARGFTLRLREGRRHDQNGRALPFTLHVGHFEDI